MPAYRLASFLPRECFVIPRQPNRVVVLGLILLAGAALRLINIGFGLPAMYDPDEPMFVLKAFKLLNDGTLNPGWFGHPGTTTIYLLAMVDLLVVLAGLASGRFATIGKFAAAVYADPRLIFVPSRLAMVVIGVATIWLTFMLARRLFDATTGLVAAAFLAINALHVAWSQVIRTDIQCSFFMLGSLLCAVRAAQGCRMREFALAGLLAGFAMATKWPGASILIAAGGAAAHCWHERRDTATALRQVLLAGGTTLLGLFLASPFVFIDWRTVIANVGGEVATGHLGHSGHGLVANLWWYLREPAAGSMGWLGLALTLAGLVMLLRRPIGRATLLPAVLAFLILIAAQQQIWSRWLTTVLPLLCIAAAFATVRLARWAGRRVQPSARTPLRYAVVLAALVPSAADAIGGASERANDTRAQASAWAGAHFPPGSSVVVEQLALDLRPRPWRVVFPIGAAGCVDGKQLLRTGVKFEDVQKARRGSAIVDLGNVPAQALDSCRVDFAILTYYDLYRAEAPSYAKQLATYNALIGNGRTLALFVPEPGVSGGPTTRIVALGSQRAVNASVGRPGSPPPGQIR